MFLMLVSFNSSVLVFCFGFVSGFGSFLCACFFFLVLLDIASEQEVES